MHEAAEWELLTSKDISMKQKSPEEFSEKTLYDYSQLLKQVDASDIYKTINTLIDNCQMTPFLQLGVMSVGTELPGVTVACTISLVYRTNDGPLHDVKQEIDKCGGEHTLLEFLSRCVKHRIYNNQLCFGYTELLSFERPAVDIPNVIAVLVKVDAFCLPNDEFRRYSCPPFSEEIVLKDAA